TRTHLDQVGTVTPDNETDRALLRRYLVLTGPFTPAPPPPVTYSLTLATSGSGTAVASPALSSYVAGSSVTLTAVPDAGWQFTGWSGDLGGPSNPATIVMDASKNILATFVPIVVPPSIANPPASLTVNAGDSATFAVGVSGTAPFTYQWRKDGGDLP